MSNKFGGWYSYSWSGAIKPASNAGVVALGAILTSGYEDISSSSISISGISSLTFNLIDLTETGMKKTDNGFNDIVYRGGIQSLDKGFTSSPISIPIPVSLPVGYDIGFVDSGIVTIATVWFDGLDGRDKIFEDWRTLKNSISENYRSSPLIFVLSNRAYGAFLTGYSSNLIGGQGNIISARIGLQLCRLDEHYGYSG